MNKKLTKKLTAFGMALAFIFTAMPTALPVFATSPENIAVTEGEPYREPDADRQNFMEKTNSKHAYEPFAQFDNEEEEKAYRENVQYVAGSIVYKVTETKNVIGSEKSKADKNALASMGIDLTSARELHRKKVKDGVFTDTYEVTYEASLDGEVWDTVDTLAKTDGVVDAQPNYLYEQTAMDVPTVSTDPEMAQQWHHDTLSMPDRWKELFEIGIAPGAGTVVAVIDTGVDYTHPDLAANMWVNTVEKNGTPGVDDDGNGYIDDIYGVSTVGPKQQHTGNPMDDHGHGTHVAGIIGMTAGNLKGGVGLAYGCKIMAIKAGQATGVFSDTDIAEAIRYAMQMGADVINMSFGGWGRSFLIEEALSDAFSKCVLVAAAGNDGLPTTDARTYPKSENIYPAAYPYVLGVMATDPLGKMASFSNWDYTVNGGPAEYELTAPGVGIFSTLPGGQYALWSGTSMAAPMVSAVAAIVRSKYMDKELYSSRFIMGQLASATDIHTKFVAPQKETYSYAALSPLESLHKFPEPNLYVKDVYLFDDPAIDPKNDGDGIVDAGEVIEMGLVLRNQWGMAGNVSVKVDAISHGGAVNPNIEFLCDSIVMEDIGTFNEQNNSFRYDSNKLVGTDNPIRFRVKPETVNDSNIGFNITVTYTNAMDQTDQTVYTWNPTGYEFTFFVQRGRTISGEIKEDLVMTANDFWIVENSIVISEGVTVTVEPGTQIQFWPSDPNAPFADQSMAYIMVKGNLLIKGAEKNPVEMFPSSGFKDYVIDIHTKEYAEDVPGVVTIQYANILNPWIDAQTLDHVRVRQNSNRLCRNTYYEGSVRPESVRKPRIAGENISNCIFANMNIWIDNPYDYQSNYSGKQIINGNLFDNCAVEVSMMDGLKTNNVFLGNQCSFLRQDDYDNTHVILRPSQEYASELQSVSTFGTSKYALCTFKAFTSDVDAKERYPVHSYIAKQAGGILACINSEEELNFLRSTIPEGFSVAVGYHGGNNEPGKWEDGSNYPIGNAIYGEFVAGYITSADAGVIVRSNMGYSSNRVDCFLVEYPDTVTDEQISQNLSEKNIETILSTLDCNYNRFYGNAILNSLLTKDYNHRLKLEAQDHSDAKQMATGNYWGTENPDIIKEQIHDKDRFINKSDIIHDPILTLESPELEKIYPFVTDAYITDLDGNRKDACGYEEVQVHVTFNRDMDVTKPPVVFYGPSAPFNDYILHGEFITPRHYMATTKINTFVNAGTEYIRVKNATAANDAWLTTGTDTGRFAFKIENTGAKALTLQAAGGTKQNNLSWVQDDFDTLAGYHIYRSVNPEDSFVRITNTLIPGTIRQYTDTAVQPGVKYYYYFTVVGTDLVESKPSNIAEAMPIDDIKPILTHNKVMTANAGESISFTITATDNIGVTYAKLYWRVSGTPTYHAADFAKGDGSKYFAILDGKEVSAKGMEYYIEISDGISVVRDGSAEYPNAIAVDNSMAIYSVSVPQVDIRSDNAGLTAVINGVNFTETMTLTVGEQQLPFTYISTTQVSFAVPTGGMGRVDILLQDADRKARLTNAISYVDNGSEAQITAQKQAKVGEEIKLPITASVIGDIYGLDFAIQVERRSFSSITFEKANLDPSAIVSVSNGYNKITVGIASSNPMKVDGLIGYLVLKPNAVPATIAKPIQILSFKANAVDLHTLGGCNLMILPSSQIKGRITYYNSDEGIANVKVTLNDGQVAYTDASGYYTFLAVANGKVVITPEFHGEVHHAISSQDASLALQAATGENTGLTDMQKLAADVDGDGILTSQDASYILRKIVGKITDDFPGSGREWTFSHLQLVLDVTKNVENADFKAILLGDVTGNWTATASGEME